MTSTITAFEQSPDVQLGSRGAIGDKQHKATDRLIVAGHYYRVPLAPVRLPWRAGLEPLRSYQPGVHTTIATSGKIP